MIYDFSLKTVGFVVGLLLIVLHLWYLVDTSRATALLRGIPRSKPIGIAALSITGIWFFWLVATMDLGEFSNLRTTFKIAVPVAFFLTLQFVDDYLAVRALGMLAMLAAEPVLEAAFLRPEISRLLVVILAYVWILSGIFWIGMPHLMRDQIAWVSQTAGRLKAAALAGLVYGVVIFACAFTW